MPMRGGGGTAGGASPPRLARTRVFSPPIPFSSLTFFAASTTYPHRRRAEPLRFLSAVIFLGRGILAACIFRHPRGFYEGGRRKRGSKILWNGQIVPPLLHI